MTEGDWTFVKLILIVYLILPAIAFFILWQKKKINQRDNEENESNRDQTQETFEKINNATSYFFIYPHDPYNWP